jgi:hypothetical protein
MENKEQLKGLSGWLFLITLVLFIIAITSSISTLIYLYLLKFDFAFFSLLITAFISIYA